MHILSNFYKGCLNIYTKFCIFHQLESFRVWLGRRLYYSVSPMSNTSYHLDVVNAFNREDNYVNVGPKSTAPRAQSFRFIKVDDSTYQIMPKMSTTRGIAIWESTGTRTVLKTLNGNPLQEWSLTAA